MKRVLIYVDEEAVEDSIDLLETARSLYGAGGFQSFALALGGKLGECPALFDHVVRPRTGVLPNYQAAAIAHIVADLHGRFAFDAILVPATSFGRTLAPRVAARLKAGLVADVTSVGVVDGSVEMVRPAFSGRLLAHVACTGSGPVMMSVRPRTFSYSAREARSASFIDVELESAADTGIRLLERQERAAAADIRECEVLVAGGGGALRNFDLLASLAAELDGMVAASRKAVDSGIAPRSIQVGHSGKNVAPRLYLALGISGSAQHVAGIGKAERIIAVNTDRDAPICGIADIAVEGEVGPFVEGLTARIRAAREAAEAADSDNRLTNSKE